MGDSAIKVHYDGQIFHKQSHGGISRVFQCLFREISNDPTIEPYLHLERDVDVEGIPKTFKIEQFPQIRRMRPERLFKRLNGCREEIAIRRHLAKFGRGIFHSTFYSSYSTPGLTEVLTLHDMLYEDHPECFEDRATRARHIAEKKHCIEAADAIVCVSEATRQRLYFHYPESSRNRIIRVIHNGCSPPKSGPREISSHNGQFNEFDPFMLHVGSRHPHKNFNRLLEVMSLPGLSEMNLVSIGGGNWSGEEGRLIDKFGLAGRLFNIPAASDQQIEVAYRAARVAVLPSISEGFGLPLLEALSFGCPVACSRGGSLPEVGGDVPHYFDPLDLDEMRSAIVAALSLRDQEGIREKGIKRASEFSWQRCAAEYADLYRELGR
jgi:glycosyltransferase involved in cell wall biosynthesis